MFLLLASSSSLSVGDTAADAGRDMDADTGADTGADTDTDSDGAWADFVDGTDDALRALAVPILACVARDDNSHAVFDGCYD